MFDVAIIGGGLVGLATARALLAGRRRAVVVLEAEDRLAAHQSGRNSGVIHAGLYYRPGSLKARLCIEGRDALYRFCRERGVPHERCGKVVVAAGAAELPRLRALHERGAENGLTGLRLLSPQELREIEPHAAGAGALHVAETGIVDFGAVTRALAEEVAEAGGEVRLGCRVEAVARDGSALVLQSGAGEVRCGTLINCAGLQADRVARLCGAMPGCLIVPFRGEFFRLSEERRHLVRNLIYPVPDPRLPFLGVHLTRRIGPRGEALGVDAGPTAVPVLERHGYGRFPVNAADAIEILAQAGFWRMAARRLGCWLGEFRRSTSRRALAAAAARLVPEISASDLHRAEPGVRAYAVDASGSLLDDFHVVRLEHQVHVLNAPSPAATACLAIGRHVAGLVEAV